MDKLPNKELLRPDEVAEYLRLKNVCTVFRWCDRGIIASVKIGGVIRIERQAVVDLMTKKAPA